MSSTHTHIYRHAHAHTLREMTTKRISRDGNRFSYRSLSLVAVFVFVSSGWCVTQTALFLQTRWTLNYFVQNHFLVFKIYSNLIKIKKKKHVWHLNRHYWVLLCLYSLVFAVRCWQRSFTCTLLYAHLPIFSLLMVLEEHKCRPLEHSARSLALALCDQPFSCRPPPHLHQQRAALLFYARPFFGSHEWLKRLFFPALHTRPEAPFSFSEWFMCDFKRRVFVCVCMHVCVSPFALLG